MVFLWFSCGFPMVMTIRVPRFWSRNSSKISTAGSRSKARAMARRCRCPRAAGQPIGSRSLGETWQETHPIGRFRLEKWWFLVKLCWFHQSNEIPRYPSKSCGWSYSLWSDGHKIGVCHTMTSCDIPLATKHLKNMLRHIHLGPCGFKKLSRITQLYNDWNTNINLDRNMNMCVFDTNGVHFLVLECKMKKKVQSHVWRPYPPSLFASPVIPHIPLILSHLLRVTPPCFHV